MIASTECVLLVSNSVSTAYGMQVSAEKTQLMTNNINGTSADFTTDNKKLETAHSFKYLGAIVSDQGLKPQVLSRTSHITAAVDQKHISIGSKIRPMRSLVLSIFSYVCETWT